MICDKCQRQATYSRKYSGETLCSECFSNSILHKAAKTISKYKMIKNDEEWENFVPKGVSQIIKKINGVGKRFQHK